MDDALLQSLPDDPAALKRLVVELAQRRDARIAALEHEHDAQLRQRDARMATPNTAATRTLKVLACESRRATAQTDNTQVIASLRSMARFPWLNQSVHARTRATYAGSFYLARRQPRRLE